MNTAHSSLETLTIKILKIIWKKDEFAILAAQVLSPEKTTEKSITVKGNLAQFKEKTVLEIIGSWQEHSRYGLQFCAESWRCPSPENQEGIIEFLAALNGLSRRLAERIYEKFGTQVYEIIEQNPNELLSVSGIGRKILEKFTSDYQEKIKLRELIEFLGQHQIPLHYAPKIYQELGKASVRFLTENPYQLIGLVRGIGFKRADEIATKLGIQPHEPCRLQAAIKTILGDEAQNNGHSFSSYDELFTKARELVKRVDFSLTRDVFAQTLASLESQVRQEENRVYMIWHWNDEHSIARSVTAFDSSTYPCIEDIESWIGQYEQKANFTLADQQKQAIRQANKQQLVIVSGGAGTGKSTIARAIVALWQQRKYRVVLCAPTGRAAQRLAQATGCEAQTIHRLLAWNGNVFIHNRSAPLECDAVLVDESGMIDNRLLAALLDAIPGHARVVMLGDPNQLLPIGCGMAYQEFVTLDLAQVKLNQIFRQSKDSGIISVAYDILDGKIPTWTSDAQFIPCYPTVFFTVLEEILKSLLNQGYTYDDIQILAPMNKGDLGNFNINSYIQNLWNPHPIELCGLRPNDRIINVENNYNKLIFNGDLGKVLEIDTKEQRLKALFNNNVIEFSKAELDPIRLAYSMSVHKAQGSEFPVVICPLFCAYWIMLEKNLLYTAVTRAKQKLILVGQEKALQQAIRHQPNIQRRSTLQERIADAYAQRHYLLTLPSIRTL